MSSNSNYGHSAVLTSLKTVTERIVENHTSSQLFEVLDKMLYRSINPIIINTQFVDRMLALVLSWYSQNHKRKITSLSKEELTTYVLAFISSTDSALRCKIYRKMRFERNITAFIVQHWLSLTSQWPKAYVGRCKTKEPFSISEDEILSLTRGLVTNSDSMLCWRPDIVYWFDAFADFRHQILEKYQRFVMLEAYNYCKMQAQNNPHLKTDVEEVAQNFILAVFRAIDKFDERQGTLTPYIQNWIMNAKISSQFRSEYGTAYNIPHSKKMGVAKGKDTLTRNISISTDDEKVLEIEDDRKTAEESLEQEQENMKIRRVAKVCDPVGVARLLFGIREVLTHEERRLLHAHAAKTALALEKETER